MLVPQTPTSIVNVSATQRDTHRPKRTASVRSSRNGKPKSPPTLHTIPAELLDEIAFHACLSATDGLGPPSPLIPLLLTCKSTYGSLSASLPLFARIFRSQFDTSALYRRFPREWLTSQCLYAELRRRWIGLKRLKEVGDQWITNIKGGLEMPNHVWSRYSAQDLTGDMWTAFLMLMESDGRNYKQVVVWTRIKNFLDAYMAHHMLPLAKEFGFQPESATSSLAVWLSWFTTDEELLAAETPADFARNTGLIRPFVFGAHRYNPFFAPWSVYDLPLHLDDGEEPRLLSRYQEMPRSAYMAIDILPRDNRQIVHYLHRQLVISAPLITHAAIMTFFLRIQRGIETRENDGTAAGGGNQHPQPSHPAQPLPGTSEGGVGQPILVEQTEVLRTDANHGSNHYATTDDSTLYDIDFNRLTACLNPYLDSYPSERQLFKAGAFNGVWEGRFAYFDFDAYQDMLLGHRPPALVDQTEVVLGQQPQVWRIIEYHLLPSSASYKPRVGSPAMSTMSPKSPKEPDPHQASPKPIIPLPTGPALNAHIPLGARFIEYEDGLEVYEDGKDECLFYKKHVLDIQEQAARTDNHTEGPSELNISDSEEEPVLDTLFTGSGHSAWGPFVLRGRLRRWDGLISLLKDYSGPQGRGQWLYRGYVSAGQNWVGRWRDTLTEVRYTGYEGAFGMRARR